MNLFILQAKAKAGERFVLQVRSSFRSVQGRHQGGALPQEIREPGPGELGPVHRPRQTSPTGRGHSARGEGQEEPRADHEMGQGPDQSKPGKRVSKYVLILHSVLYQMAILWTPNHFHY